VGPTIAPNGSGQKIEISEHKQRSRFAFEKEHNVAWYKLVIKTSGHLSFDIIPTKKDDDYDFMLFKAGPKTNFCDSLQRYHLKPERACISRDKETIEGKTGLSFKAKKELVKEGVGDAFVTPIFVTKGEEYYLVLDNVYDNGDGHAINFFFEEPAKIRGIITDENNKPVSADITLTNAKGDTIQVSKSNKDGVYEMDPYLRRGFKYSLNFYNDSTFIYTKNIALKDTAELKNIRTILPYLKKGKKYSVGAINFKGGLTEYIPQAVPAMENLYRLMRRNKNLKIKIIGHSNGHDFMSQTAIIKFTTDRAVTIQQYLTKKGIDISRIQVDGVGDKEMLFPDYMHATLEQQEQNRRVEVLVLEY
jgi:outer membrane protein OmpA-like peptidoglycan-associated protein